MKQCATPPDEARARTGASSATNSSCASRWCRKTGFPTSAASSSCAANASPLRVARRVVAKEIEAAFADGDERRVASSERSAAAVCASKLGGMVRVHPGRREQARRVRLAQSRRLHAARDGGARHDDARDARGRSARENSSRSASKLSCVRLAPMSIKSSIWRGIVTTRDEREQRGALDFGHAFDKIVARRVGTRRVCGLRRSCGNLGGAARSRRPRSLRLLPRASRARSRRRRRALDRLADSPEVLLLPRLRGAAPRAARRHRPCRAWPASARARERDVAGGCSTKPFAAEAWVLVAACALVARRRSPPRAGARAGARARRRQPADRARGSMGARAERRATDRGAARSGRGEARRRRRGVRRLDAVDRRPRLGSRRGVDGACRGRARARPGAHGARSRRAGAAACAGLSRGGRAYAPRCRARGPAIERCNAA